MLLHKRLQQKNHSRTLLVPALSAISTFLTILGFSTPSKQAGAENVQKIILKQYFYIMTTHVISHNNKTSCHTEQ